MTIELEYHSIANTYPMMSQQSFNNLVASMEDKGFDENHPIILFEGKILDGRNRYKASLEARVDPNVTIFEGTFEQALEESRRLNSFRRNLSPAQKAMVAAKEVLLSRASNGKKLSTKKASILHDSSESYVKLAIRIIEGDEKIAENVFNGKMSIKEALYRIEQIHSLREPINETTENYTESTSQTQTQEIILEFKTNEESAANRVIALQNSYLALTEQIKTCETCDKFVR